MAVYDCRPSQGQVNPVTVNHIIARGTIDEDVMRVLQKKGACQEDVLEAVKARLKKNNSWRVKEG
jgi:SNF2 family DNA or RNA helicase